MPVKNLEKGMKGAFQGCLYLSWEFNKIYFWPRVIPPTPAQEVG